MPEHGSRYLPSLRCHRAKICIRKQCEPGHRHDEQTHVDESLEVIPIAPNDDATTSNVISSRLIYATTSIDTLTIYDWSTDVAANAIVDDDASLTTNGIVSTTTAVVA